MDHWKHRTAGMKCRTCMYFVAKDVNSLCGGAEAQRDEMEKLADMAADKIADRLGGPVAPLQHDPFRGRLGRCRRNAPTMKGWPAIFEGDWCGDHKLDENKI